MECVAIRPPEYFPRLSYMALVAAVDTFVVADTFQYSNRSFHNRTRLRSPQGWHWVTVPLRGPQHGRPIDRVEIENKRKWPRSHRRSFEYDYRSTMYFEYYEDTFVAIFERTWERLGPLTARSVELLHGLMELDTRLLRASSLPGRPDSVAAVLGALGDGEAEVWAPPAAAPHDAEQVERIKVFHFEEAPYHQNFEGFEPGLSAADMLFNYGPETVSELERRGQVVPLDAEVAAHAERNNVKD